MMRTRATHFRATFGLDLRSLAAMRIGLAGVVLTDLAIRASDFHAMYSSAGLAPVEFVRSLQRIPVWSLHLLSGSDAWQVFLFGLATVVAVAMLVGYRTRLAVIASWILLTSVQMRMPMVLNAGDTLLRVALFWSMFLPLGAVWSSTAFRRDKPSGSLGGLPLRRYANPFVSVASFAFDRPTRHRLLVGRVGEVERRLAPRRRPRQRLQVRPLRLAARRGAQRLPCPDAILQSGDGLVRTCSVRCSSSFRGKSPGCGCSPSSASCCCTSASRRR